MEKQIKQFQDKHIQKIDKYEIILEENMIVINGKNEDLRMKDNYLQQLENENEEKVKVI